MPLYAWIFLAYWVGAGLLLAFRVWQAGWYKNPAIWPLIRSADDSRFHAGDLLFSLICGGCVTPCLLMVYLFHLPARWRFPDYEQVVRKPQLGSEELVLRPGDPYYEAAVKELAALSLEKGD